MSYTTINKSFLIPLFKILLYLRYTLDVVVVGIPNNKQEEREFVAYIV